ncbi:hypothetical protein FEK42_21900 [Escherichia sp. E2748]|nr:hypothetical protein CRI64_00340 [Escherichia sp. E2748]TLI79036.1 hypothetical protein FEK42_21900 [Escherichia sp. E2748]
MISPMNSISHNYTANNMFLNAGIISWGLALFFWYSGKFFIAVILFFLIIFSFSTHFLQKRILMMFNKAKTAKDKLEILSTPESVVDVGSTLKKMENRNSANETGTDSTVIASDVVFDGNINSNKQIYIYGCVNGNVIAKDGLVKIMRNGVVEGNITSRELIVDGNIKGHCQSDSVDIYENGRLDGTLVYVSLSIKKGGVLTGKAEVLTQAPVKQKIVELKSENVTVVPEKSASREKR